MRAQTPLMYAAASNRAAVIELLAAKGADLKATNKVTDLAQPARAKARGFGGNPQRRPAAARPDRAAAAAPPGAAAAAPRADARRRSQLPAERADRRAGRPHAAALCRAPGLPANRRDALLKAGADVNQRRRGDRTSPLLMAVINGHFDLAKSLLEKGAERQRGRATTA